jgi:hypothetical protein
VSFQEANNISSPNFVSKVRRPNESQQPAVKDADKPASLSDDYTYFGVTKTQNGGFANALSFKIKFKNGSQNVIQYHELISPFEFNGSDLIELATTRLTIKIKGSRLEPILDHLAVHRLTWMKEHDSTFPVQAGEEPAIESIIVET